VAFSHVEKPSEEWTRKSRGGKTVATPHSAPKKNEQQSESDGKNYNLLVM
jgi:hypothetical protein